MNLNSDRIFKKVFFLLILLFLFVNIYADDGDVYLSLSASGRRASIGLADFVPVNGILEEMGLSKDLKGVLENDLILSRHFNVAVADTSYKFDMDSQFEYWQLKNISVLLTGSVAITDSKNLVIKVKLFDMESKELIWEEEYSDLTANYRYIAHLITNEVVKRTTGEEGIATSKIAFINDSTKFKEIYVIDYDGHNLRRITKDNKLNILPKWVPNKPQIIYTSYLYNNSDLFLIDIERNKRKAVSTLQGLNSPAAFSPDGKSMISTLSRGVYPNLYLLSAKGEVLRRLTQGKYIDTSPCFAPSGREIVFVSDRAGYPQIYIMDIEGVNIRRISTRGNCDSPMWSPKGDKIAFTMKSEGKYDIFLYDLPKEKIIRLTQKSGNNENPSWSQDGRFIVFSSTRSGKSEIYIMGIDGSGTRKLADIPGKSYTPSWSYGI